MRFLPNGQWTLSKSEESPEPTTLHGLVGKTHTVEVHPHIDHLYRLKNHIQTQPNGQMPIREIKKTQFGHLADKLPRSAKGNVTPEMIDKHIEGLPKHKVEVKVVPYKMGAQQHREGVPQYAVSVGMHPDTLKNMSPKEKETWASIKDKQHNLGGHENQVGWARIDPYKVETERSDDSLKAMHRLLDINTDPAARAEIQTAINNHQPFSGKTSRQMKNITPNEGHWHIDEIQSDFGVPKVLKEHHKNYTDPEHIADDIHRDAYEVFNPFRSALNDPDTTADKRRKKFVESHPELAEDLDKYLERRQKRKDSHEAINAKHKEQGLIHEQAPGEPTRYWTAEESEKAAKIREEVDANIKHWDKQDEPWDDKVNALAQKRSKERSASGVNPDKMHELLSHGHEDPMHMVHSAVNQLGRQNGIQSMSMDTPNHQAHQSGLRPSNAPEEEGAYGHAREQVQDHIQRGGVNDEKAKELWDRWGQNAITNNQHDIHFKSASEKLGPEGLKHFANQVSQDNSSWLFNGHEGHENSDWDEYTGEKTPLATLPPETRKKLHSMTPNEKDALSRFAKDYDNDVSAHLMEELGFYNPDDESVGANPDEAEYDDLPVHQVNTYDKRPKKLGFQTVDKKAILGEHPWDQYNQVQYAKLHKKLRLIQELLRKA